MERQLSSAAVSSGTEIVRSIGKGNTLAIADMEFAGVFEEREFKCVDMHSANHASALFAGNALYQEQRICELVERAEVLECPILVIEGNAGYQELALCALAGSTAYKDLYDRLGCPHYTEKSLISEFEKYEFECVAEADIKESIECYGKSAFEVKGAQLHRTLSELTKMTTASSDKTWFVRLFAQKKTSQKLEERKPVFLTVLMRTQGKRTQALREALLCLNAQSDEDFEIILIGHKVTKEGHESIQGILDECPSLLRNKIRYYELSEGGRAAPINMGFRLASGEYMAIFDDDDILTADWVSAFHRAYQKAPGAILHSYCVGQDWRLVIPRDKAGLRAESGFDTRYCCDFDWMKQLHTNYCPLMTLAFPVYLYQEMEQHFDESLEVMEDWDFLIRMASFCGVQDEAVVTSIYRMWKNAENSHVMYDQDYWERNYDMITKRHKRLQLLLPKGASDMLRSGRKAELDKEYLIDLIKVKEQELGERERQLNLTGSKESCNDIRAFLKTRIMDEKLYCNNGRGWTEENTKVLNTGAWMGKFEFSYEYLSSMQKGRYMRWDPCSLGGFMIKGFYGSVTDKRGNQYFFKKEDISSNGIAFENGFLFMNNDPQIFLRLPKNYVPEFLMIGGEALTSLTIGEVKETKIASESLNEKIKKLLGQVVRKMCR